MADVQIQQEGGRSTWLWAIVVLVLIAILAYVFLGRGDTGGDTKIEVTTPSTQEPAPSQPATPQPTTP